MKEFAAYLAEAVGEDSAARVLGALEGSEASTCVRRNPRKISAGDFGAHFGSSGLGTTPVPWCPDALRLGRRPVFTLDPLLHTGAYYVQDSSSMFPVALLESVLDGLDVDAGVPRVLDLCAAPGGKTTQLCSALRARYGEGFVLVANEVMQGRLGVLRQNLALWGDPCVVVTGGDPSAFGRVEGFFDMVLVDAPCSGEGMFRKDPSAREQWSPDNVELCAARQRRILSDVLPALREGGLLVYSTCTLNLPENEDNVDWMCSCMGLEEVSPPETAVAAWKEAGVVPGRRGFRLMSGFVDGEGQYACILRRTSGSSRSEAGRVRGGRPQDRRGPSSFSKGASPLPAGLLEGGPSAYSVVDRSGTLYAVPSHVERSLPALGGAHIARSGVALGQVKGKDFVPDVDLATSLVLSLGAYPRVDLDRAEALRFLHKDPVGPLPAPRGVVLLTYKGLGLGFVKNLGTRVNSLLPPGRRIRMDIGSSGME